MATWKSKVIQADNDFTTHNVVSDTYWEYQTTVDIFSFHQSGVDTGGYIEGGPFHEIVHLDRTKAELMLQALANWCKVYESEGRLEELLKNNPFDRKEGE